jgi:hypothetical protein
MPAAFQNASIFQLAIGVFFGSLIVSVLLSVVLKFVAQSVLKYPTTLIGAFKALFVWTFTLNTIIFVLVASGAVNVEESGGIALQIIGLAVGVVILAFTVAIFIRDPAGIRPDFAKAGVVAAIMQVISLIIALVLMSLKLPMTGAN